MPQDAGGPPPDGTDSRIAAALAGLRQGDPTAKNELLTYARQQFTRMARKLLRSGGSYELVHDWEQTDDVVQGLMVRMSQALDKVTTIESPRDFFTLAAKNIHWELQTLRDSYGTKKRGSAKRMTNVKPNPQGGEPVEGGFFDCVDERRDMVMSVSRYLDEIETIPPKDREMLDMIVILGLTREEAAARLGMTLATFKRRYREACDRLYLDITDGERPRDE